MPADAALVQQDILQTACHERGTLLSLGDSAVFELSGDVIARITRLPGQRETAEKELAIARWLASADIPAITPIAPPIHVQQHTVTLWAKVRSFEPAAPADIATLLRRLHSTPPPTSFALTPINPFVRIEARIAAAPLTDNDRKFLRSRLEQLRAQWRDACFDRPTAVIHGDPHAGNVVTTESGVTLFMDLERFAIGPPEWDLTLEATEYHSFGWRNQAEHDAAVHTYGYDVLDSAGYPLLRDIRELRMTTWLAHKAANDPLIAPEIVLRIDCLRGKRGPRPWPWQPY